MTITVPKSTETSIISDLAAGGLLAKAIDLQGRFHSPALESSLERVVQHCKTTKCLQLPTAERLLVPLRNNFSGELISEGRLSEVAAEALLTKLADWRSTVTATMSTLSHIRDAQVTIYMRIVVRR